MNRLVIPAALASIVLFAGVFAFIPVNNASTVHEIVQGNGLKIIRESTTITDGADNLYDGSITISLDEGTTTSDPFTITALYLCDINIDTTGEGSDELKFSADVEGFGGAVSTGGDSKVGDSIQENNLDNSCVNLIREMNSELTGAGQSGDVPVVIDLDERDDDAADDADGATVVVYAQVRSDVSDTALVISSTTDDS